MKDKKIKRPMMGIKMTMAAIVAILVADMFELKFSTTAGIITILSIQKTKKETLRTAGRRTAAFLLALLVAGLCFYLQGFHVMSFAVYLLLFSSICLHLGWVEVIAMDSVLITHFLSEGNMGKELLFNELMLFAIGTGFGIFSNLHLRRKKEAFEVLAEQVDTEIRGILKRMAERLLQADKSDYNSNCFQRLEKNVVRAKESAFENFNNQVFGAGYEEIAYIKMRENQIEVLKHIYESIKMVEVIPKQTTKIAELILKIEKGYHKENTVAFFLQELKELFEEMKKEELPVCREEFEARAVLFYIMKQLEEFLILKKRFAEK